MRGKRCCSPRRQGAKAAGSRVTGRGPWESVSARQPSLQGVRGWNRRTGRRCHPARLQALALGRENRFYTCPRPGAGELGDWDVGGAQGPSVLPPQRGAPKMAGKLWEGHRLNLHGGRVQTGWPDMWWLTARSVRASDAGLVNCLIG